MTAEREMMAPAYVFHSSLSADLGVGPDILDITPKLDQIVRESGIGNGVLTATIVGSTGSITTIEYEPGVLEDLKAAVNRLAPPGAEYAHEKAWHDGNGHSHVQAALMGPSVGIAVRKGRLKLGTWQQVVVINHDNRSRKRPVEVTVTGTAP